MNDSLDDLYFDWLRACVLAPRDNNYEDLLLLLHRKEFTWVILNDRNRAADGKELRFDFLRETNYPRDQLWVEYPCSMLEMLIGLSKRAAFQTDMPVRDWFWRLIINLRLDEYRQLSPGDELDVQNQLDTLIWRTYTSRGDGGLFPIRHSKEDQRKVEIWYQLCEYVQAESLI